MIRDVKKTLFIFLFTWKMIVLKFNIFVCLHRCMMIQRVLAIEPFRRIHRFINTLFLLPS